MDLFIIEAAMDYEYSNALSIWTKREEAEEELFKAAMIHATDETMSVRLWQMEADTRDARNNRQLLTEISGDTVETVTAYSKNIEGATMPTNVDELNALYQHIRAQFDDAFEDGWKGFYDQHQRFDRY